MCKKLVRYLRGNDLENVFTIVYPLKIDIINVVVPDDIISGNYRKGFIHNGFFDVIYVGRTDTMPLKERLLQHAAKHPFGMYFNFNSTKSPIEAYERECQDFHKFGGSDELANMIHPNKPDGVCVKCPICRE